MRNILAFTLIAFLCSFAVTPARGQSDNQVTPDRISVMLRAGECTTHTVQLTTGAAAVPRLDVAIVTDVTGSMHDQINAVQERATEIVERVKGLAPQTRFAVATVADYPEVSGAGDLFDLFNNLVSFGDPGDYPWRVETDFSPDAATVQAAVNRIELKDGGDVAESYLRALNEARKLNWLSDSRRIVIFFGDSYAHDPDPGPDNTLKTGDDLTATSVTQALRDAGISVFGIYTQDAYADFYKAMASATGGQAFALPSAEQAPEAAVSLLQADVRILRNVSLRPDDAWTGWMTWTPDAYDQVGANETVKWNIQLCRPPGAGSGEQRFNLAIVGSGSALHTIPVTIETAASLPPWLPFLGVLPLVAVILAVWRLRKRPPKSRQPRSGHTLRPPRPTGKSWQPTGPTRPRRNSGSDVTPDR